MFKNLSIKKFIIYSFSAMSTLILLLSAFVYVELARIGDDVDYIVEHNVNILTKVSELSHHTLSYRRFALDYGLTESQTQHRKIHPTIEHHRRLVGQHLDALDQVVSSDKDIEFVTTFRRNFSDYIKTQENYIALIDTNKIDLARKTILEPMLAPFNAMIAPIEQFQRSLQNKSAQLRNDAKQQMTNVHWTLLFSA
ncbi:MCP four helix bundle domain-containing protein [Gammaproteobacteria bacterium AH-315-M22]|nr:MCP four helix bundle domain-containing protein [Gammaproteobacteria bacterium AH-315-M22]